MSVPQRRLACSALLLAALLGAVCVVVLPSASPPKENITRLAAEADEPAAHLGMEEKSLTVDGVTWSYAERGSEHDGVPLVMLHGYLDSWKSFTNVIAALPQDRRILSLTQRGWGDSAKTGEFTAPAYAADIPVVLAALGVSRCVLVGHSMGTLVAPLVAVQHPALVAGMALCSAASTPDPLTLQGISDAAARLFAGAGRPLRGDQLAWLRDFQLADIDPFVKSGQVSMAFEEQVMRETLKGSVRAYAEVLGSLLRENHTDLMSRIAQPVLIIWGTEDTLFTAKVQQRLAAALRNAPLTRRDVAGAPHGVIWTHGSTCAGHLTEWLRAAAIH